MLRRIDSSKNSGTYQNTCSKSIVKKNRRAKKEKALAEVASIKLGVAQKTTVDEGLPHSDFQRIMEKIGVDAMMC